MKGERAVVQKTPPQLEKNKMQILPPRSSPSKILRWSRALPPLCLLLAAGATFPGATVAHAALPFDQSCPVILDNDWAADQYDLYFAMALASAGKIQLKGIICSNSYAEQYGEPAPVKTVRNTYLPGYQNQVNIGRSVGFTNIPDPVEGPHLSLKRPASGNIDDTAPQDTPGVRLILAEAAKPGVTSAHPLVIVGGGQSTAAVSAYLIDHSIANKMVLAWDVGNATIYSNDGYNGFVDSWASYIVLQRLRAVTVAAIGNDGGAASITPSRLRTSYPNNALRVEMLKIAEGTGEAGKQFGPITGDFDGLGLVLLMRPDYVLSSLPVSFGWFYTDNEGALSTHQMVRYRSDPASSYLFVASGSGAVATDAWWAALTDPAAYHSGVTVSVPPTPVPPVPVPPAPGATGLCDLTVTGFTYSNGVFQCTVKNQGTAAVPPKSAIGVEYFVDGVKHAWGASWSPLAARASVAIGTNGAAYRIPKGTHTILAFVDDVFVIPESNDGNNTLSQSITL